jgi:gamma-glutamyl:cysteine ligase YbdK (ATP-grasp superfamily)
LEFSFGIEHEVAFLRENNQVADFTNTTFAEFNRLIALLPLYPGDYPLLHVGDAGIRVKRWYIEGVERLSDTGELVNCIPKGIEIRTTRHSDIGGVIRELSDSFAALQAVARPCGLTPVCTSFNPFQVEYAYDPPLTEYEKQLHEESADFQAEALAMLTYGPDLNLSLSELSTAQVIDAARKLTCYSPYLVPWSFNSPFYAGKLWDGLSVRTHVRSGQRSAVRVFVEEEEQLISSTPVLTKLARTVHEVGRIEFKAFDSCGDFGRYAALLALLKGLVLDQSLPGRATLPDVALHREAAREGFRSATIRNGASRLLAAAETALGRDPDAALLGSLHPSLHTQTTPAHALRSSYQQTGSIIDALRQSCGRTYRSSIQEALGLRA